MGTRRVALTERAGGGLLGYRETLYSLLGVGSLCGLLSSALGGAGGLGGGRLDLLDGGGDLDLFGGHFEGVCRATELATALSKKRRDLRVSEEDVVEGERRARSFAPSGPARPSFVLPSKRVQSRRKRCNRSKANFGRPLDVVEKTTPFHFDADPALALAFRLSCSSQVALSRTV